MQQNERLLNVGLGISIIYWGVAGFIVGFDSWQTPILRYFITLLNLTVGSLILFRQPVIAHGSVKAILRSLPSLVCGGLLFKLSIELGEWATVLKALFITGVLIAFTSFLFLGKSFSILPGLRKVKTRGPFTVIRHPAYFGETLMMLACLLAASSYWSVLPFVVFVPTLVMRINAEERLLSSSGDYRTYKKNVKWRLLPYVW